jgi:hypothetical protein
VSNAQPSEAHADPSRNQKTCILSWNLAPSAASLSINRRCGRTNTLQLLDLSLPCFICPGLKKGQTVSAKWGCGKFFLGAATDLEICAGRRPKESEIRACADVCRQRPHHGLTDVPSTAFRSDFPTETFLPMGRFRNPVTIRDGCHDLTYGILAGSLADCSAPPEIVPDRFIIPLPHN